MKRRFGLRIGLRSKTIHEAM